VALAVGFAGVTASSAASSSASPKQHAAKRLSLLVKHTRKLPRVPARFEARAPAAREGQHPEHGETSAEGQPVLPALSEFLAVPEGV
jgi:hypothetical protein